MEPHRALIRPIITEKSTILQGQNKYAFEVAEEANKLQIKDAVEKAFKVRVLAVNVMTVHGKSHRRGRHISKPTSWKKAIVTLQEGDKIEFFEGV